jgi:class 3 adenylate cyclase/tetratricopeptide (TPR) repeat protein
MPARQAQDGERRHLTVLFCDLVNSTEIAAQLDPEEWRDILARYQRVAAEAVARFDGRVAQYLGDGVLALFGYPSAHENEAERAVRTGLEIIEGVSALNAGPDAKGLPALAARVGIHAGPVVVGDSDNKSANVFGDTPNMAARVQAAAEHNTVVVSAAVYQLVSGQFVVEDRGAQTLKGIDHPVQLYRVIQPNVERQRIPGGAARVRTPFVGREEETRLLLSRWERAREGQGQVVLVVGEPGIGKSRLVEEFRARIKDDPHLWIAGTGEQFFENTPFHAVTQMLDQVVGWRGDDSGEERVSRLERALERAEMKLGEAVPLIVEMVNLPIPSKYPPVLLAPDLKRKRLLANLVIWVLNVARLQPVVVALENLHWVDPSTLELQQMLVEQSAAAPLLLIYTTRPEFHARWPMRSHHAQIALGRLGDRPTREMVASMAGRASLDKDVIDAVVKRTDGVPLFVEELTRLILESDRRSVAREIPATLQDSLAARLDRLGLGREVAQVAAVIGREFSYELLHPVMALPEDELQSALRKLADSELIHVRGIPPGATYRFKHSLIQDAAYEALLKSRRKELHRRIAQQITEKFASRAEEQPALMARHWTEAGMTEAAVTAWRKAGEAAYTRRAFHESEEGYRQALAMLKTLPESPERDARELELTSALIPTLQLVRGYAAPKTVEAIQHVRTLAEKTGDLVGPLTQMQATWAAANTAGDYRAASMLAEQMLDLAGGKSSPITVWMAHDAQFWTRYYCGDLVAAEQHFLRGSGSFDDRDFRQTAEWTMPTLGMAALNAAVMGRADVARERIRRALAVACECNSHYTLTYVQFLAALLHLILREPEQAETLAARALALSEENGVPYHAAQSRIDLGRARAALGFPAEGASLIRGGLKGNAEIGARAHITLHLTWLAEAQALEGAIVDALGTIEEALLVIPEQLVYRPETLRLRGELQLRVGRSELAEADHRQAIRLAQKIGAKWWELRATVSFARLLAKQSKRAEARTMLADIYSWFTEGFDTADLKDAKTLLDQLSS